MLENKKNICSPDESVKMHQKAWIKFAQKDEKQYIEKQPTNAKTNKLWNSKKMAKTLNKWMEKNLEENMHLFRENK